MEITEKTAQLAKTPTGRENLEGWLLEPKYDGWRMLVVIEEDLKVRWFGRSGLEYSGHTPVLDQILNLLPPGTVLDGELVHPEGWRHAQEILGSEDRVSDELEFYVFDILQAGNQSGEVEDARRLKFIERRQKLEFFVFNCLEVNPLVQLAPQEEYSEDAVKRLVVSGFEGGVAKDPDSVYQGGKRSSWVKFKAEWTEDAVVYGGIAAKGELEGLVGSLKIGQYNPDGVLIPLGNSWGKFSMEERRRLTEWWKNGMLDSQTMVVELTIQGFTNKGKFRAPVIQRIRLDKQPKECTYTDKSGIYAL